MRVRTDGALTTRASKSNITMPMGLMFSAQRRPRGLPRGVRPEPISKLVLRCLLLVRLDLDLILPILFQRMTPSRAAFMSACWIGSLPSSILATAVAEGAEDSQVSSLCRHRHPLQMFCSKQICHWLSSKRTATRMTLPLSLPPENAQERKPRSSPPSSRAVRSKKTVSAGIYHLEGELMVTFQERQVKHQILLLRSPWGRD
mmetsp:Transcript_3597/g.8286  ORF Transcript_3597/g.8286 Transcript_3597/m.8286 type:complete len:202 (+) Transcript_3597:1065-1670(+)